MTRWHEDDLAGRLLQDQGEKWTVLRLPALADSGAWDFLHAFTGNTRAAVGLLYRKSGATDTITVPA